jgi:hypothetical protein
MIATALLFVCYGLVAVLVLGVGAVLLTVILGALRLALRRLRRVDPYEPAAAEAPDPVERHYASVGDTFGFGDGPLFAAQVESMLRRAGEGVDVYDGAPKEQT